MDLVRAARKQPRLWRYLGTWTGRGFSRGGDEYGRHTLVLGFAGDRAFVWAYWTCTCTDCDETRAQTATWGAEDNDGGDYARYAERAGLL